MSDFDYVDFEAIGEGPIQVVGAEPEQVRPDGLTENAAKVLEEIANPGSSYQRGIAEKVDEDKSLGENLRAIFSRHKSKGGEGM